MAGNKANIIDVGGRLQFFVDGAEKSLVQFGTEIPVAKVSSQLPMEFDMIQKIVS